MPKARKTLPRDPWERAQVQAMDKLRDENKALTAALQRLVEAEVAWEQDRPGWHIELANARFNAEKLIGDK